MPDLSVSDRVVARVMAVVPAVVVGVCVRVLTLASPPPALRVIAAGLVATACWTAYRLLTVRVSVGEDGMQVRGVFYDARLAFAEIDAVEHVQPHWPVRALVWGLLQPHAVQIRVGARVLRPLALVSVADDDDVERLVGAIRARSGAWRVPAQRATVDTSGIRTG